MASRKLKIFNIFDENPRLFSSRKTTINKSMYVDVLSKLYSPGLSYQYMFDFGARKFIYISSSVYDLFGVKAEEFSEDEFLNRIHPDDYEHFLKCEKIAGYFLFNHIERELITKYKVSYQMRMRDNNGNYRLILHQAIAIGMDEDMNLSTTLINQSDISHITNENNYKISFINIEGNKSYYNIDAIADLEIKSGKTDHLLSKRELEILGYLAEGLSSKEIAENIFISPDTVRTHRNNILRKTKFKSMSQAIGYFIREGLI